ncbi:MAG: thiolase family protein [Pseudomonadota bacterium]
MFDVNQVVFSGSGQSAVGRKLDRSAIDLTLDAAIEAIENAGLDIADIDGLCSYPGVRKDISPGFGPVSLADVKNALGLSLKWHSAGWEGPAQAGAIVNACIAVASGLCRHVLVFRAVTEASSVSEGRKASVSGTAGERISGPFQWMVPFGGYSAVNTVALYAQRHFHDYGTTRETLGEIALNCRNNAALNPKAIYTSSMTMADYLSARMISSPLCLFDCDIPVDASTAVIVSRSDAASDTRRPIYLESMGCALSGQDSWDNYSMDLTDMAAHDAAKDMWSKTDLAPADVDVAQLYDGFSMLTLSWIEALGFCKKGEAKDFLQGGANIARDGLLPLNTHGGQLSAGRTHGFGYFHEAILQLRGEAGERQLSRTPSVAVVANGGGPLGSCFLLRAD